MHNLTFLFTDDIFLGTEDNVKVADLLMKAWAVMEPNSEQIGLQLFRSVFFNLAKCCQISVIFAIMLILAVVTIKLLLYRPITQLY